MSYQLEPMESAGNDVADCLIGKYFFVNEGWVHDTQLSITILQLSTVHCGCYMPTHLFWWFACTFREEEISWYTHAIPVIHFA